jgi:hypothetical protein
MPTGGTYGPVLGPFYNIPFSSGRVREVTNITLNVPPIAPAGVYVVRMKVGDYPNVVDDESNYGFIKTATGSVSDGGDDQEGLVFEYSEDLF